MDLPLLAQLTALADARPALVWGGLLTLSLAFLVKSADVFTDAAEVLGRSIGLAPFVIGVTIVALGTSLPELVASVLAVWRGASEIVMGNVIGSNIANLGLVLGLAAIIGGRLTIERQLSFVDLPFLMGVTVLGALMSLSGTVDRLESLVLVGALVVYLHLCVRAPRLVEADEDERARGVGLTRAAVLLVLAGAIIYASAEGTITAILELARAYAVTTETLAVTVVAIGTSLPEVAVTALAARRGRAELAVGNIVGSNVFNLLAVAGLAGLIGPLAVPSSLLTIALPTMVGATLVAVVMLQSQVVTRWEGWLLMLAYAWFLGAISGVLA
jgi:cation:H+ antiporter